MDNPFQQLTIHYSTNFLREIWYIFKDGHGLIYFSQEAGLMPNPPTFNSRDMLCVLGLKANEWLSNLQINWILGRFLTEISSVIG